MKFSISLVGIGNSLAMVTGIDSASSNYAWCKCPALEHFDSGQQWSISDVSCGARMNISIADSRKKKFNVSNHSFPQFH